MGWSFLPNAFWKWDFTKKAEPTTGPSIFIFLTLTVSGFIKSLMRFWIRFFSRVSSFTRPPVISIILYFFRNLGAPEIGLYAKSAP